MSDSLVLRPSEDRPRRLQVEKYSYPTEKGTARQSSYR
jgi:hypothetical protein